MATKWCRRFFALALAFLFFSMSSAAAPADKAQEEAAALIQRSEALSGLRVAGVPPFRLKARVTQYGMAGGKTFVGEYVLTWVAPDLWRELLRMPGSLDTEISVARKHWEFRNLPFEPVRTRQLKWAIAWLSHIRVHAKKVGTEKLEGKPARCLQGSEGEELCFDPSSGTLLRASDGDLVAEYAEYSPFGGKLFPRRIRVVKEAVPALDVQLEVLAALAPPPTADDPQFAPPAGARELPQCADYQGPKVLKRYPLAFPHDAALGGQGGTVVVYLVVGADGRPHDARVIQTAFPALDGEVLRSVDRWTFRPASCDGNPVPAEYEVEVEFYFE